MALENTDLLVAYRPSDKQHYRVKVEQFNTSGDLPDGTSAGQVLTWDGSEWVAADGGGSAEAPALAASSRLPPLAMYSFTTSTAPLARGLICVSTYLEP